MLVSYFLKSKPAVNLHKQNFTQSLVDEGYKEPAAVLACGALEDSMKKFAAKNDIEASDADLSKVINSLKTAGLLKGTQAGVAQSYITLRNKAFHAQFDKLKLPEIAGRITFVEAFLTEHFG